MKVASSESQPTYVHKLSYSEELALLIKWKAIPLGSLHNLVPKKIHKTYSYRLADKLVRASVAHKIKNFRSGFHVLIPSSEVLKSWDPNFAWLNIDKYCRSAFIASAFFELPLFCKKIIRFCHEEEVDLHNRDDLRPDFSLGGVSRVSAKPFEAGVFFESKFSLTPVTNTENRMMKFLEDEKYSVFILVFTTLYALNKCKAFYFESSNHNYGKKLQGLICLVCIEDYVNHPHKLIESYAYFDGEETTLQELFK
jgi:hypothetical protein